MKINACFNYVAQTINSSETTAATVKITRVALYVLKASEGVLASYATRLESGLSICYHFKQIFSVNDNCSALLHLQAAGMHALIILSDVFKNQIVVLILDIKEVGTLIIQLGRDFGKLEMLYTLGHIAITGFSIYTHMVPSPENITINVLIKIASELGQSFKALCSHEWLDAIGFLAAAGVRGHVNRHHFEFVNHKWQVLNSAKFQKVWARILQGRDTTFLKDHPLEHLREAIENQSEIFVLNDDGDLMNLGANFSNLGGGQVKDMRLTGRIRKLSTHELIELRFKLTRVARKQFDAIAKEYSTYDKDQLNEFLHHAGVAKKLSMKTEQYFLYTNKGGIDSPESIGTFKAHQIQLEGLGTVNVGAEENVNGLYKNVSATIAGDGSAEDMHMLLSLAGMGQAMVPSTPHEIVRWKIGLLFRTFYPSEAIEFQRTPEFFDTSLDKLMKTIVEKQPNMKDILMDQLPVMSQKEIRPGWLEWTIPNLSHKVADAGGSYLIHNVTGLYMNTVTDRVVSMLKMGMLSTASRFESGQLIEGMSSEIDIITGGSDSVFTRLHTNQEFARIIENDYPDYHGEVNFLISLDTLNRGSYQYHSDEYGKKGMSSMYVKHDNIIKFAESQSANPTFSNEVMLNQTVMPNEIKAVVLSNASAKHSLIDQLEKEGMISIREGKKYFQERLVDDFIFSHAEIRKAMQTAAI